MTTFSSQGYTSIGGGGVPGAGNQHAYIVSADATGTADVWTPAAGKKFVLTGLIVSSDTAMNLIFKDEGTAFLKVFVPANGGAVVNLPAKLSAAANNDLKVTASVAGNIAVTAWGYEVT